jgi:hypothetical protein
MIIRNQQDLINAVKYYGFLPLFKNEIEGFSVEEMCISEIWFQDNIDGPWEWKGPLASSKEVVYGKFFNKKCGFISIEWFHDFFNYRRDGYDFDARFNDHLASYNDLYIYNTIENQKVILSKTLKNITDHFKGLDTIITRLQMQCYIIIVDFEYNIDKHGKKYGWGIAKYSTPEYFLGQDYVNNSYLEDVETSKQKIINHLCKVLKIDRKQIEKILR